jgi:hypothetical protein
MLTNTQKSYYTIVIVLLVVLFPKVHAEAFTAKTRPVYLLTGALDNFRKPLFHSQQTSTELLLSAGYGLSWLQDYFECYEKYPILSTVGSVIVSSLLSIRQHEYTGHGLQGQYFERRIQRLGWPYCINEPPKKSPYLQQQAIIYLAGIQSNMLLSQSIVEQFGTNNSISLPYLIRNIGLWSTTDQPIYAGVCYWEKLLLNATRDKKGSTSTEALRKHMRGDISRYIGLMEIIYGKGSITHETILRWSVLDLVNPFVMGLLYRQSTAAIPYFNLGNAYLGAVSVMPMLNLMLTPYNVLEKRLSVFCKTEDIQYKLTFGFGKERKSNIPLGRRDWLPGLEDLVKLYKLPTPEVFKKDDKKAEIHHTFYIGLDVYKLYCIDQLEIGFSLAGWRQPELFTRTPRYAPIQFGGMLLLKLNYRFTNQLKGFFNIGYKSNGFILGYPPGKMPIIRGGLSFILPYSLR